MQGILERVQYINGTHDYTATKNTYNIKQPRGMLGLIELSSLEDGGEGTKSGADEDDNDGGGPLVKDVFAVLTRTTIDVFHVVSAHETTSSCRSSFSIKRGLGKRAVVCCVVKRKRMKEEGALCLCHLQARVDSDRPHTRNTFELFPSIGTRSDRRHG
ncbi:hypothetical protein QCA50_008814 [Cerrena zonata]|uniref:Uncharacterized protein n=1 Tax=Cerrena zonata TaxID=2478898 RepID=A0AAW0G273_9APHY